MAETLNTRVTRLEKALVFLAEAQTKTEKSIVRLDNAMAHLAEVRAQDQTEARERERRIDERIEKLVGAMGEFLRNGKT